MTQESAYYDIIRRSEIKEENRKLRRLFLRYKEAEIVYSIQHSILCSGSNITTGWYSLRCAGVLWYNPVSADPLNFLQKDATSGFFLRI